MSAYWVEYKEYNHGEIMGVQVPARSKADAYERAVWEILPAEGVVPYSAWVSSVTYNNGNYRVFNNHEGNPY